MSQPVRRSVRLPDFDYTASGAYFTTICTHDRTCLFGDIVDGDMRLNGWGEVVQQTWDAVPEHFRNVALDQFVIMPNHVHGIVMLNDEPIVGATHASPLPRGPKTQSIGAIVGSFKSAVTKHINTRRRTPGHPVWQRNYYEHVIRNDRDLVAIRDYVAGNPARWHDDENHPGRCQSGAMNRGP